MIHILAQLRRERSDNRQYVFDSAKRYHNLANLTLLNQPGEARRFNDEDIMRLEYRYVF